MNSVYNDTCSSCEAHLSRLGIKVSCRKRGNVAVAPRYLSPQSIVDHSYWATWRPLGVVAAGEEGTLLKNQPYETLRGSTSVDT